MENITSMTELKEAIATLKQNKNTQEIQLKSDFQKALQAMQPASLIKNTVKELSATPEFKDDLLTASVSIGAGFLTKKLAFGNSSNPLKQVLGTLLQFAVTKAVSKNSDEIKGITSLLISKLFQGKKSPESQANQQAKP